jgi:hypothetical protein
MLDVIEKEVINTINSFYDLVEKIRAFGYGGIFG